MKGIKGLLRKKSFWTRLVTGVIIVVLVVLTFVLGYTFMLCVLGILSLMGLWELFRAEKLLWSPFTITAMIADIAYYVMVRFYASENIALYLLFLLALFAIADIIIYVINYPRYEYRELITTYFSVFYIGVSLSFLYLTRVHPWGAYLVWLAIIASWGNDTCAYLGGSIFGKHRIFPDISPKKTIEGCISGVIGSGILAFIYALIVGGIIPETSNELIIFPIVCIIGAIIGTFGDLFASSIKRRVGIKDFSNLLPGHGGILDRFDSVILVSPIIYAITILMRL